MQAFSSVEVKSAFGDVVQKAQEEPSCIQRHGKPRAYRLSVKGFDGFQAAKKVALLMGKR
jgi:hypothetical protein